ncbi:hypothetical protein GCM10009789_26020 [Kribbella sancticallisti]|uniref:Restriction endonuclease n=2 Tax=Kribbella sancticallisti TaxID=460087 RepID=A0ABN2D6E0_9ACTN
MPWETSLTDWILLALASTFPAQLKVVRFAADREAQNGADWEWWFRSGSDYAGMRVQAKRRDANGSWGLKAKAPGKPAEKQVDRLVRNASASGLPAFYCLYSDRPPRTPTHDQTGPCPHGPLDPNQHGISLLLARTAQRHASQPKLSNDAVASEANPWYGLVCIREPRRSLVETVRAFLMTQLGREYARQVPLDLGEARWVVEDPVGANPPDDIRQAFDDQPARDRLAREGLAGIVLFSDDQAGGRWPSAA